MDHAAFSPAFSVHSGYAWSREALQRTMILGLLVLIGAGVLCWHQPVALVGLPVLLWAMHTAGLLAWITESTGYHGWIEAKVARAVGARSQEALRQAILHPDWPLFAGRLHALTLVPPVTNPYATGPGVHGPDGQGRVSVLWQWTWTGLVAYPLAPDDWWAQGRSHGLCINTLLHTPVTVSWREPVLWPLICALPLLARSQGPDAVVSSALVDVEASAHRRLALHAWALDGA